MKTTLFYLVCNDSPEYVVFGSTEHEAVIQHKRLLAAEAAVNPKVCQQSHFIRVALVTLT